MAAPKTISQRELRNNSGEVMRAIERGESFIVTRNGLPVASLTPIGQPRFAKKDDVVAAMRGAPRIDHKQFFEDIDRHVDQDPTPRG